MVFLGMCQDLGLEAVQGVERLHRRVMDDVARGLAHAVRFGRPLDRFVEAAVVRRELLHGLGEIVVPGIVDDIDDFEAEQIAQCLAVAHAGDHAADAALFLFALVEIRVDP